MANRVLKLRVRVVTGNPQRTFVLHESARHSEHNEIELEAWVSGIVFGLGLAYGKDAVHLTTQDSQDAIACSIVVMLSDDIEGHAPSVTVRQD
jgi:hypothetical protein